MPGTVDLPVRVDGLQGTIEVVERDGLRQLIIDGTVHGAVPVDGAPAARDAMVGLLQAVRPAAKTALVIGLGTGTTAGQLAGAGLEVLSVELEPQVIELARAHFGFTGEAVAADGLAFLAGDDRRWDLILVDALAPVGLPAPFLADDGLALLRDRLAEGGVLAVRMVEAPRSTAANALLARQGDWRFHLALGSGIGDEQQNLYLLDSDQPISFDADPTLALWPLTVPGRTAEPLPTARETTLLGYLVRVGPDATLCLDLLHWEMGAVRFVLGGDTAALEALIPAGELAPDTESPRAEMAETLAGALGDTGFQRSDVRFSPIVVALRGTATFRTAIDADDLARVHADDYPARMPLLPYGGVLYDLDVAEQVWRFDLATWKALRKRALAPAAKQLKRAVLAGDLRTAHRASLAYQEALEGALGDWREAFAIYRLARWVQGFLILEVEVDARSPKKARKEACARLAAEMGSPPVQGYAEYPDLDQVPAWLERCATRPSR